MDIGTALSLVSTALSIADQLNAIDAAESDELRETALIYKSRTMELKAYTNSSRVGVALVRALDRQMERDSHLLQQMINQGLRRIEG